MLKANSYKLACHADVAGLRSFLSLGGVELDLIAFFERLEARGLDSAEVNEDVFAAVVRGDKAETFCVVKPLHRAFSHCYCPLLRGHNILYRWAAIRPR